MKEPWIYFAVLIKHDTVIKTVSVTKNEFDLYSGFKDLQSSGFTEKSKEWSPLKYKGFDLTDIESHNYLIGGLFKYHMQKQE